MNIYDPNDPWIKVTTQAPINLDDLKQLDLDNLFVFSKSNPNVFYIKYGVETSFNNWLYYETYSYSEIVYRFEYHRVKDNKLYPKLIADSFRDSVTLAIMSGSDIPNLTVKSATNKSMKDIDPLHRVSGAIFFLDDIQYYHNSVLVTQINNYAQLSPIDFINQLTNKAYICKQIDDN